MITIKSTREFELMAVAGRCVAAVHTALREAAKPGVSLLELDEISRKILAAHKCTSSFLGYHGFPATICASPNDGIVHGIPTDYRLEEGDVLAIDSGAIYEGFHGDAAFTMAIGDVPDEARRLIDTTERAMWAGIAQVKPGNRVGDIGAAVQAVGEAAGYGIVQEYVGHGIGRQMHEEPQIPNYGTPGKGMRLRKGMALCIEPMFTLGSGATKVDDDEWTVRTEDGSVAAHWEHTVCLTADGPVVTTLAADAKVPVPLG